MPNDVIPLPEPVYYQWRRKNMPWSLEFAFSHMCHATAEDSEIRTLHPGDQMHAHAAAVSAERDARIKALEDLLWVLAEHNELHFGKSHSTVIQCRAALGDKT